MASSLVAHNTASLCLVVGLLAAVASTGGYACDRAVCAPVVGKCVKSRWCECDQTNYSCCKECFGSLFSKCCDCVDACPKKKETTEALNTESDIDSYVGEINNPFTPKFMFYVVLGINLVPHKYPITLDAGKLQPKQLKELNLKASLKNSVQEVSSKRNKITLDCVVVYINKCLSWNHCENACATIGAVSYRWFFDGCCECVGENCNNFGLKETRCKQCPTTPTSSTISNVNTGYGEDTEELQNFFKFKTY